MVDISARRSSYDEYQDGFNDSTSEREILVGSDGEKEKLKAVAL